MTMLCILPSCCVTAEASICMSELHCIGWAIRTVMHGSWGQLGLLWMLQKQHLQFTFSLLFACLLWIFFLWGILNKTFATLPLKEGVTITEQAAPFHLRPDKLRAEQTQQELTKATCCAAGQEATVRCFTKPHIAMCWYYTPPHLARPFVEAAVYFWLLGHL